MIEVLFGEGLYGEGVGTIVWRFNTFVSRHVLEQLECRRIGNVY